MQTYCCRQLCLLAPGGASVCFTSDMATEGALAEVSLSSELSPFALERHSFEFDSPVIGLLFKPSRDTPTPVLFPVTHPLAGSLFSGFCE